MLIRYDAQLVGMLRRVLLLLLLLIFILILDAGTREETVLILEARSIRHKNNARSALGPLLLALLDKVGEKREICKTLRHCERSDGSLD